MTGRSHFLSHVTFLCKHQPACLCHYLFLSKWFESAVVFLSKLLLNDSTTLIACAALSNSCLISFVHSCSWYRLVICVLYCRLLFLSTYFWTNFVLIVLKSHWASSLLGKWLKRLQNPFVIIYALTQLLALGLNLLKPLHVLLKGIQSLIIDVFTLHGWEQITIDCRDYVLSSSRVCSDSTIEICRVFHRLVDICMRDYVLA